MMYNNKLVCCLKANGKILREHKDVVYVPFGTEYSVLLKNLNTVRALVTVEIDGINVADGEQLVVDTNGEFELTRFIKNNNLTSGNRFKFIERTPGIEQHRGVGMEDGIIRVEFQFERVMPRYVPPVCPSPLYYRDPGYYTITGPVYMNAANTVVANSYAAVSSTYSASVGETTNSILRSTSVPTEKSIANDAGITVPGSLSLQEFKTVSGFPVEMEKHVMVLKLLGETETGKVVMEPITVHHSATCTTCGKKNKFSHKFCSGCGTSLTLV